MTLCGVCRSWAQVEVPLAGNVSLESNVSFLCPSGAAFEDTFGGLFAAGAFKTVTDPNSLRNYLASTLEFVCRGCGPAQYATGAGSSTGAPGQAENFPCLPCPPGAECEGGAPTALPGYWGATGPDGTARFVLCPPTYCCDGGEWACDSAAACAGNRGGALCGDCAQGFLPSLGTAACVPRAQCEGNAGRVWGFYSVMVLAEALFQLIVVSQVWLVAAGIPDGRAKVFMYFFQVGGGRWCVTVCV